MILGITLTAHAAAQLALTGLINGTAYGLLGVGFALILGVTGRFHFAYGFGYALAAYGVFWGYDRVHAPFVVAILIGLVVGTLFGLVSERLIYRPLAARAGATALLAIFVASLGLGIAGQNVLALGFSSAAQQINGPTGFQSVIHWGTAVLRWEDVWQMLSAVALVLGLAALLKFTGLGRSVRATRGNPEMARVIGINPHAIYLVCFGIASLFCAVAAFWDGVKFSVTTDMGFTPVIFAFVVAFLAGTASSPIRVFIVGILISEIQQLSSLFLAVRYQQLVIFVVLLVYLVVLAVEPRKLWARMTASEPGPRPT